jgi:tungstate transport system ATP-binding protein
MSEYILKIQQVNVSGKKRKNILDIEHFALRPGELVALLGPNGAGKSTLLNTINLLQPFQGQMELFGHNVHQSNQTLLRRRSALVFQEKLLLNDTVFNNVARALQFRGIPTKQIQEKVYATLANFSCEHLANRSVRSLSGGEAKRVCIARGLVTDPELLLLDEPSASLDLGIRSGMIEKIRQWAEVRGASAILVSHNFTDILRFADRAIALFDGSIVQDDKLETLIHPPANEQLARLVGIDNIIPCQVKQSCRGYYINLSNGIKFSYPGEIKKSITACCLSSDTFNVYDANSSIQHKPWSVIIEGLVERVVNGMGTYNIWVKVGEQTLIARVPRTHISDNLYRHEMIKLSFNAADAHFV